MNFILLDVGRLCISKNIYSWAFGRVESNLLENNFFGVLLLRFIRQDQRSPSLMASFFPLVMQDLSGTLSNVPWIMKLASRSRPD